MKTSFVFVLCVCLFSAAAVNTQAATVPGRISYQGFLTAPDGSPLDTVVSMTFKLYDAATSGAQLWTETQPSCTVRAGLFNAVLGSVTAVPDSFYRAQVWLGVTVGSNSEMVPRTRMISVPYAYRVGTVDGAAGGVVTGKVNIGADNANTGDYAFVIGRHNQTTGNYSIIAAGGVDDPALGNVASGDYSAISGGYGNTASGSTVVIGGGYHNMASNAYAIIDGGMQNAASGYASVVGGGRYNRARGDYSIVAGGGGISADSNSAIGNYSVIGGGYHNLANGDAATIAGGYYHTASGNSATVSGGYRNTATNYYSAVGGGTYNNATGQYSMIPGGTNCSAAANYSFAAGRRAKAYSTGCFVWADSYNADFSGGGYADSANNFLVRASGGVCFFSNTSLTSGVRVHSGANSWVSSSDSTKKRNIRLVDTRDVLDRVSRLPIKQWSYKSQDPSIEHIGPMAQDFWAAFHLGEDSLGISTIDPDGIALAAIQELAKRLEVVEKENGVLRARVQTLEADQQKAIKEGK